ncbi:Peptidase family S41 [compost metagenome]
MYKIKFLISLISILSFNNVCLSQTKFQKKKLEDLAEIYGLVRYFHPSPQSTEVNWNNFLLNAVNKTLQVKNNKEYEELIKCLFQDIAPTITYVKAQYKWNKSIDTIGIYWQHKGVGIGSINPKGYMYQSIRKTVTGKNYNRISIPAVKNVILKQSDNFLINIPIIVYSGEFNPNTQTLDSHTSIDADNYSYQVTSLSNLIITWNIFRHFYPYQEEVNINWQNCLRKGIVMALKDQNDEDHLITLQKFTEVFRDGHINVLNSKLAKDKYAPPISLTMVKNKLVVKKVLNDSIKLQPGNIIKEVNSISVQKYLDSLKQYKSGSPQLKNWISLKLLLTGSKNSFLDLTLSNNQKIKLKRTINYSNNIELFERENSNEVEFLKDSILYINWDKFSKETFFSIQPQIESAKKIIIDLRGYPRNGGEVEMRNTYFPNVNNINFLYLPIITQPFYQNVKYEEGPWHVNSNKKLSAKIVLLVDERAISYPESLAQYLKYNNYVTIIGRPTAGANGNINKIRLISGFWFMYTGMLDKNPDGSRFNAKGVSPDVYVKPSLKDIVDGKDSILEAAIKYLK